MGAGIANGCGPYPEAVECPTGAGARMPAAITMGAKTVVLGKALSFPITIVLTRSPTLNINKKWRDSGGTGNCGPALGKVK